MLRLPRTMRVFASTRREHFHGGPDKLLRFVREVLDIDPFGGDMYCFFNARRDRVKLLVWDRNGFWVLCKRLERGRFETLGTRAPMIELSRDELVMVLSGIDTKTGGLHRHFVRDMRIDQRDDDDACTRRAAP